MLLFLRHGEVQAELTLWLRRLQADKNLLQQALKLQPEQHPELYDKLYNTASVSEEEAFCETCEVTRCLYLKGLETQ